jgi:protein-S-isoprenylcysteine O-methyltransferase Ste14
MNRSGSAAAVMSAFYLAAYGSVSVPAILAGVVVTYVSLQSTFEVFGSVVAAVGLVVAFEAWRTRPARPRHAQSNEVSAAITGGEA